MSLTQFTGKCIRFMEIPFEEQLAFAECLCEIFLACDMDSSGTVDWAELTDFMIQSSSKGTYGEREGSIGAELVTSGDESKRNHVVLDAPPRYRSSRTVDTRATGSSWICATSHRWTP